MRELAMLPGTQPFSSSSAYRRSRFARFQLASQSNNYLSPPSWHMSVPDPPAPPALLGTDESLEYPQIAPAAAAAAAMITTLSHFLTKSNSAGLQYSHTHCQSEKKKQIAAALSFVFCFVFFKKRANVKSPNRDKRRTQCALLPSCAATDNRDPSLNSADKQSSTIIVLIISGRFLSPWVVQQHRFLSECVCVCVFLVSCRFTDAAFRCCRKCRGSRQDKMTNVGNSLGTLFVCYSQCVGWLRSPQTPVYTKLSVLH